MNERFVYWKEEPERRPWNWIPYRKEPLEKALSAGAMFITWTQFSHEPGNGHGEPVRYGNMPLDFDDKENPQNALSDLRVLCLQHLPEIYDLDPDAIKFYASGSKGFHATIPAWAFGHTEGHTLLPLIYKKIATRWAKDLGLKTLDLSLYCMNKGKMFRLPNVQRSIGTFKVPLTIQDAMQLDAKQLAELTRAPRQIERVEVKEHASDGLKELWETASETVEKHQQAKAEPLPAEQLDQIKGEPPPCVDFILKNQPAKTEAFNFNRAVMLLANYFQDAGWSYEDALKACQGFLEGYQNSDSYSTPQLRFEHFTKQWNYMLENFGYFFNCERAQGLGLPPEAYDCLRCLQPAVEVETVKEEDPDAPPADDQLAFPFEVMQGAAGYFADTYGSVMEAPEHFLFMGYLTCLGAYFAPYMTIESELRTQPRLFTVLVGESATDRKSTTLNKVVSTFKTALPDFKTCWGIGSAEGMQRLLKKREDLTTALSVTREGILLVFDEFKSFVAKCNGDKSVLLPAVNSLFESNIYETHVKDRSVVIEDAYFSMLAATTRETYERVYTPAFIAIGFPNRVFLVPGHATRRFSIPPSISDSERKELHGHLIELRNFVDSGLVFNFTPEAKEIYHAWYLNGEASVHSKRLDTYSLRLMQLLALNSTKRTIDAVITENAIALCDWQLSVRKVFDPIDADCVIAEMEQKILRFLERGPAADRELKVGVHAYRAGLWSYDSALNNLKKAKEISWDKKAKRWRMI